MKYSTLSQPTSSFNVFAYPVIFLCFIVSGFCSLLYQVVWTRLAFANFGIITPVLSLIVSVFMLGIGLGSLAAGKLQPGLSRRLSLSPLYIYAAVELIIAAGAFIVPVIFKWGESVLLRSGATDSTSYLLSSAIFIVIAVLPWSTAMGATIPLMMAFVRQIDARSTSSFSLLYLANVIGGATGALAAAFVLIEIFGIRGTYEIGSCGNVAIALLAIALGLCLPASDQGHARRQTDTSLPRLQALPVGWSSGILFSTGFISLGLEVCWARDFTYSLLTTIYAFAAILAVYLLATAIGSLLYRAERRRAEKIHISWIMAALFVAALLPVILTDPRLGHSGVRTLLSIIPFCGILGFVTPSIIDRAAQGDPGKASRFYAVNIGGSILGPLAAAYLLLPSFGIRFAMILLALPFFGMLILTGRRFTRQKFGLGLICAITLCFSVFVSRSYDDGSLYAAPYEIHRDFVASVVADGAGMDRHLYVNSIGITVLTTLTKIMADLPMALNGHAKSTLDICFGMGTTFRSLVSWNVDVTAVDLSSAVTKSFGFFHSDTAAILANPHAHIVADDGRRYLMRTHQSFDVITIDPPPPVEAAGSSLLYSEQFYAVLRQHLRPGGILQQWIPLVSGSTLESVALSLKNSFPYVLAFRNSSGVFFIASSTPIPQLDVDEFIQRMPLSARQDLMEWADGASLQQIVQEILGSEIPLQSVLPPPGSNIPAISDDRPYNEYFFLRRLAGYN